MKKDKLNTNSTVGNRERRLDLKCSYCPPNKKENKKRQIKRNWKKFRKTKFHGD
jgi:hypothetical protein